MQDNSDLYLRVVEDSLNALIESGKLDSGRTSYDKQCEFRRRYIKRTLKKTLGKEYSQENYDKWNDAQYRCGW